MIAIAPWIWLVFGLVLISFEMFALTFAMLMFGIAAILTAAPKASVELWNAVQAGDHERALDLHERLLVLWNAMIGGEDLPAATKSAQAAQGVASGMPRMPMKMPPPARQAGIRDALKGLT